jgi:3-hydroxybutyryl-CoA dehydrogenase
MKITDVKKVAVFGGGLMGRQIALNTAIHGFEAYLTDNNPDVVDNAAAWAESYLQGRAEKGKMTEEAVAQAAAKFHPVKTLEEAAKDADIIIEAIIEDEKIKRSLFADIDKVAKSDAVIATNSSRMVSSVFKDVVSNPARLANLHYFNPALVMKLTEVVQGSHTSEETVQLLMDFARSTGKDPVWVKKEIDGFLANRVLRKVTDEALYLLEEGVASPQDIDTAVEKGLNYPMGPFKLMDFTGLDTCYLVAKAMLEDTGYRKPGLDLLREKYESKEWGRKTGKGWYSYEK